MDEVRKQKIASRNIVRKGQFKFRYVILILILVFIGYIYLRYHKIINEILNPKSISSTQSNKVNLTYRVPGNMYFVKSGNLWKISGNNIKQITKTGYVSDIAISPDQQSVYFSKFGQNSSNLYKMNINGSNIEKITNYPAPEYVNGAWWNGIYSVSPAFSPNGQNLVYSTNLEQVFTLDPVASLGLYEINNNQVYNGYYGQTQLTQPNPYTGGDTDPTWPNQNFILYTHYVYLTNIAQPDSQIMLYYIPNGQSYPVTPLSSEAMQPALSSQEKYLAFIRRQGENNANLYVMKFDLGAILSDTNQYNDIYNNTLDLVKKGIEAQPAWSPYGPNLAFLNLSQNSFDIVVTGIKTNKMGKINTGSIVNITKQSNIDSTSKFYWEK